MKKKSPPKPVIRSEFPTVSWYEPKQHYRIDARAKGGTQHYRAHRDEALALANQIASDYEAKGKAAFSDPTLHEELLKALGTNPQEVIAQWLRTHSETNGSKPTGEAFDEFARSDRAIVLNIQRTLQKLRGLPDTQVHTRVKMRQAQRPRHPVAPAPKPVLAPIDLPHIGVENVHHLPPGQMIHPKPLRVLPLRNALVGRPAVIHRIIRVTALHA